MRPIDTVTGDGEAVLKYSGVPGKRHTFLGFNCGILSTEAPNGTLTIRFTSPTGEYFELVHFLSVLLNSIKAPIAAPIGWDVTFTATLSSEGQPTINIIGKDFDDPRCFEISQNDVKSIANNETVEDLKITYPAISEKRHVWHSVNFGMRNNTLIHPSEMTVTIAAPEDIMVLRYPVAEFQSLAEMYNIPFNISTPKNSSIEFKFKVNDASTSVVSLYVVGKRVE